MSDCVPFHSAYYIHGSGVSTGLSGWRIVGATWNCCRLGAISEYTIQPCASLQCYLIQSRIGSVLYVCLAVTYHLHFWQNDRDLLRATAVTRGWNGYPNKSQHKKLTLEKKIPRHSYRNSNPGPFDHESDGLTTELSPSPVGELINLEFWGGELATSGTSFWKETK